MNSKDWRIRMRERLDGRTKPVGSLGRLEALAEQLAELYRCELPRIARKLVIVSAADHGVSSLSLYPKAVTSQMVANICTGGAAISVLARQANVDIWLVDAGVDWEAGPFSGFAEIEALPRDPSVTRCIDASLGHGTADWTAEDNAMTPAQYKRGIEKGKQIYRDAREAGYDCIAFGDMGIGNTASAAAVAMALGVAADCIDRGTGISDAQLAEKRRVISAAVAARSPFSGAEEAMQRVGGFELLLICGMLLASAGDPCPCILDGFPVSVAALAAVNLQPNIVRNMVAGHQSKVSGHGPILSRLGLEPILSLGMRLGEGTGAVLAMPILEAATAIPREMAGFADAGVDSADGEEQRY
jgi:nicotinate-nucleotide--dimethylbenzimidazole phosphoribosyltransferase